MEVKHPSLENYVAAPRALGIRFEITDPDKYVVLSRVYTTKGRVAFTSQKAGEHWICINTNTSAWFSGMKLAIHYEMKRGEKIEDYGRVQEEEKLSALELRLQQLNKRVAFIRSEQAFQKVS